MGRGSDEVLRDLMALQENICRLFDQQNVPSSGDRESVSAQWSPPVDIYETGEAFVMLVEVPGVDQEDIALEISDDTLVMRGERPLNTVDPSLSYHRIERANGVFQRSFRLPTGVDSEQVRAIYRDGVLEVVVPKREPTKTRSVPVKLNG